VGRGVGGGELGLRRRWVVEENNNYKEYQQETGRRPIFI